MPSTGKQINTGVFPNRRPLTIEEALAGGIPEPFTPEEWTRMAWASRGFRSLLQSPGRISEVVNLANAPMDSYLLLPDGTKIPCENISFTPVVKPSP